MLYVLAALAIFGHWALCVYAINRLHATALPYWMMKVIDLLWYGFLFVVPSATAMTLILYPEYRWFWNQPTLRALGSAYVVLCWLAAPLALAAWYRHWTDAETTGRMESNHTTRIDVSDRLGRVPSGSLLTTLAARLPQNQVFELCVQEKVLRLPRLDPALDGISITHLSDLHFTGRVTRGFFDLVVDEANQLDSDLIAISGDIIDHPQCFDWLSGVLGRLRSRHGVFFVLGNHDLRIRDELRLRNELVRHGLIDLGGRYEFVEIRERSLLLAGNELPWFAPAANLGEAPSKHVRGTPFRIAISHSPDQFPWARAYDIDLMLAGHTHGGQIRFPLIGPVFSPSRYGVRYSAGAFFRSPTLMHVSRGLSGTRPLRFNCPPELTRLVLRSDTA